MAERWRPHEDQRLREWYAAGVPVTEIARRLGRSQDAVDARRRALGVPARRPTPRRWSPEQDALLRASAEAGVPAAAVAQRLGLPLEAVRRRRRALLPSRRRTRPYTVAEDEALREAIARDRPLRALAAELGRTEGALRVRAHTLGLLTGDRRRRWTLREDGLLREGYERGLGCEAVARLMLGGTRTASAVSARARRLGLVSYARTWSREEEAALRRAAAANASLYAVAERHGRTPEAIRRRARRLGIELAAEPAPAAGRRWAPEEDALLRALASSHPGRLARLLGRSDRAVLHRMRKIGLANRSPHRIPPRLAGLTPGELRLIAEECSNGQARRVLALADRLGRSPAELRRLAEERAAA